MISVFLIPPQLYEHSGPLALIIPATVNNLQPGDIAYVSCEPSDYSNGDISAGDTFNLAVSNKPNAIVLYSVYAATCNFYTLGDSQYSIIYTMQNASSSKALVDGLQRNNPPYPYTNIYLNDSRIADAEDNQSSSTGTTRNGNLTTGLVFGVAIPIPVLAMLLLISCILRRIRRRKQHLMRARVSGGKPLVERDSAQLYFQQKAELDDEQRRHEMEAVEVRYEMEGGDEIQEIPVEGRGRERHFDRQEMRGEEHSKELDNALRCNRFSRGIGYREGCRQFHPH